MSVVEPSAAGKCVNIDEHRYSHSRGVVMCDVADLALFASVPRWHQV
jgi:hypothetical protein